ncbi:MAG: hypothetical protein HY208_05615 [Nitrospirae bacterium]|nr:hypothetical protein [Nitrospirota bacterium]
MASKISAAVLAWCAVTLGVMAGRAAMAAEGNLFVTQVTVDPNHSSTLYVTTNFGVGLMKSVDGGTSWTQITKGLHSFSLTQIAVDPADSNHLYLADGCAGLYVSRDGGTTWKEMNDGLQDTEIGGLQLHPAQPGSAYAVTTQGMHKAEKDGARWLPLTQGDTFTHSLDFISFLVLPTKPVTLYLASKEGLYTRKEGDAGWVTAGKFFAGRQISALAHDPRTGRLYVAVYRRGATVDTLREGGLFISDDQGTSWSKLGDGLEQTWIRVILLDPADADTLYLATGGRGVIKSVDGGKTWAETNSGLSDPDREIHSLALDPHDRKTLYAGSYGYGVFGSHDAGATWRALPFGPHQTGEQLIAALVREADQVKKSSTVAVPPVFQKCNTCHGWTDFRINLAKPGLWMVPANRRDWSLTVKRMSLDAGLTPDEEKTIAKFLQTYSGTTARR